MRYSKIFSAVTASAAMIFTGFAPAMAAPVNPAIASPSPIEIGQFSWSAETEKAEGWRGYRGKRGHRRHRNRIDGGDILAGILVIGGIAAIASAASKNDRDRRYEDRDYRNNDYRYNDYRNDDRRYDDRRSDNRTNQGNGSMDVAINVCSNAAERQAGGQARVSGIQSVARDGAGWRVEGELSNGSERTFLCGSADGRVDFVQLGNGNVAFAN
ncbi:hypothetical protein [Parasphingorhabdus sp.]|uniref:hypothetical protein n=1 Tax=Parasphingorhabdus sp. TaxID=2709688 RepID=UPI0007F399DA|nr:hypothetical protein A8B75_15205 [Sphingomonadales bacterium EhC05]